MPYKIPFGTDESLDNKQLPLVVEVESSESHKPKNNWEYRGYLITVHGPGMAMCVCKGFGFRRKCGHCDDALELVESIGLFNEMTQPVTNAQSDEDDFLSLIDSA